MDITVASTLYHLHDTVDTRARRSSVIGRLSPMGRVDGGHSNTVESHVTTSNGLLHRTALYNQPLHAFSYQPIKTDLARSSYDISEIGCEGS